MTVSPTPNIMIKKIGIISRDYNIRYPNGFRDFSESMPEILKLLDNKGCNAALFSLYSIIPRQGYAVLSILENYTNLRMVCLEEFSDGKQGRKAGSYVVYHHTPEGWKGYRFKQAFGRVDWQREADMVRTFAQNEIPKRIIGNSCIIVCGESNGVKYDKKGSRQIVDLYGVRAAIPEQVKIILNPAHDRMSRFEMNLKRAFLSQGRLLVSVWNSGKLGINGKARDGKSPAWRVYRDGVVVPVLELENSFQYKVGIISV